MIWTKIFLNQHTFLKLLLFNDHKNVCFKYICQVQCMSRYILMKSKKYYMHRFTVTGCAIIIMIPPVTVLEKNNNNGNVYT